MKQSTQFTNYTLGWLVSPDTSLSGVEVNTERLTYQLPPDIGSAWIESLSLPDGIVLYRAVHELERAPQGQLVHLLDVATKLDEPVFCAQIWLSGLCCHREFWDGLNIPTTDIISGPGRDTFRFHDEWNASILVEGGCVSEMRTLVLPFSLFSTLLGTEHAQILLEKIGLQKSQPTVVHTVPQHVSFSLREAMSSTYTGPSRKLYAQARVLEYLAKLLQFFEEDSVQKSDSRHRKLILELRDYLIHLEGRVPTLSELAKQTGISAKRLNGEFNAEFGQSVFAFVTEQRLMQAHAFIEVDPIPLKTLATRLGYSHVNHFIAAFKRKFGYPPGSLRKKALHSGFHNCKH